ncbi:DNA topoisomerase (ATP-hydrolyzing) subunit A [Synechococcales cyanobacterium C]|uniref:DNA topoisomerase (ATP-hydrolyzing) n=1 Tax=Petrachloros mirabilis ULC683 TaxID=2781853 RepID=A0A8K1ZXS9_9CYAN|nr:DNA topoisomerase (ATP-hydrolyzing) subunit A [Petrachloros mirabilis]NCJ06072.1 DNA topoisomerase (ATP-hydrolyzing) subunit A [Petrachloros mirabilis ULC683]
MAKQLNFLATGKVISTALHTEMEQSYLEYAMSVIVGRALPDVRDGLKPVHRRILYAMHELGLTPDRPYRKCARVVGDVLGKYHPHGDQAVYDALVRLVQSFSSRYPLLSGHGNFGSVDNDPPAAMRYTETRLSGLGNAVLLSEVGEETVEFIGNFDNSQQEPTVLPAQLPILLLNGCSGIAVGMATNIPPHNLGEVVDALIALIDRPDLSLENLLRLIPGPDFPTGGEIIGTDGIHDAYTTGRGSITLRGVTHIDEQQPGRGRHRRPILVITELPFQVNKAGLIEKMAALINQKKLEGIADLRDESDRDGMRIVIELKRDVRPEDVLEQLYRQTPLQTNFGVITLALVNGQPRELPLKTLLLEFLDFREHTLQRRYQNELTQVQQRLHLVQGLVQALTNLDGVIELLRQATDGTHAKQQLQQSLNLSERQADAILAMPLRRLTSLEQQNLRTEVSELEQRIQRLEQLLTDRHELLKELKKDLRALKRQHQDARRTQIRNEGEVTLALEPVEDNQPRRLELSQKGYVRCLSLAKRNRSPEAAPSAQLTEDSRDLPTYSEVVESRDNLVVFTSSGKAYPVSISEMPMTTAKGRGVPLVTLLPESARSETLVSQILVSQLASAHHLVLLTRQGKIKKVEAAEFQELTARGLNAIKLKPTDELGWVCALSQETEVVVATSGGRLLRTAVTNLPEMGRVAQGNQALKLRQEQLIGLVALRPDQDLVLVTQKGYGKRIPQDLVRPGQLGGLGIPTMQFKTKSDQVMALLPAVPQAQIVLTTNQDRVAHLEMAALDLWGKDGAGSLWVKLRRDEKLIMTWLKNPQATDLVADQG